MQAPKQSKPFVSEDVLVAFSLKSDFNPPHFFLGFYLLSGSRASSALFFYFLGRYARFFGWATVTSLAIRREAKVGRDGKNTKGKTSFCQPAFRLFLHQYVYIACVFQNIFYVCVGIMNLAVVFLLLPSIKTSMLYLSFEAFGNVRVYIGYFYSF